MVFGHSWRSLARNIVRAKRNKIVGRRIIFFHPPKCGGTSLDAALSECFRPYARTYSDAIVRLHSWHSRRAAEAVEKSLHELRESLLAYFLENNATRFISGHFPFSNRVMDKHLDSWDLMTILRDPVSRWMSAYYYNRYKPNRDHFPIDEDIEEFVQTRRADAMGTTYVRMFLGKEVENPSQSGEDLSFMRSREAIDRAKENLEKFEFVGILEDLDGLRRDIEGNYGIKLDIPYENENPKDYKGEEIDEAVREKIWKMCAPDIEIYEFVKSRNLGRTP